MTVFLVILNVIFGLIYGILYVFEAIRSFLDFQRLRFTQKVGQLISLVMALITLVVMFSKASRQGGFSTQIAITVLYNIYMWHLAFLYMPEYKKHDALASSAAPAGNENAANNSMANQSEMHILGGPQMRAYATAQSEGNSVTVPPTQMDLNNPNDVSEVRLDSEIPDPIAGMRI